jgi:hypothetical protein
MTAILVIEALAILILGVLVVGLLRTNAEITRALHQLGMSDHTGVVAGSARPRPRLTEGSPEDIVGQTLQGSTVHVGVAGHEGQTLLAFLSTGCSACMGLWEGLLENGRPVTVGGARVVVVTKGAEAESPSRLAQLAPDGVTLVQSSEAWDSYGVPVSPYFVLIEGSTGGIVGEGSATSWQQVRSLLGQALADASMIRSPRQPDGELRADAELRKAGIGPGHPSLHPGEPPSGE